MESWDWDCRLAAVDRHILRNKRPVGAHGVQSLAAAATGPIHHPANHHPANHHPANHHPANHRLTRQPMTLLWFDDLLALKYRSKYRQ